MLSPVQGMSHRARLVRLIETAYGGCRVVVGSVIAFGPFDQYETSFHSESEI